MKKNARTLLKSKANDAILNLFSSGSICFASGNLIPTNKGFRENISLCLFINAPNKKKITPIFSEILEQHHWTMHGRLSQVTGLSVLYC